MYTIETDHGSRKIVKSFFFWEGHRSRHEEATPAALQRFKDNTAGDNPRRAWTYNSNTGELSSSKEPPLAWQSRTRPETLREYNPAELKIYAYNPTTGHGKTYTLAEVEELPTGAERGAAIQAARELKEAEAWHQPDASKPGEHWQAWPVIIDQAEAAETAEQTTLF